MRSGCVDQSWWGGRLACMADSLVKHVKVLAPYNSVTTPVSYITEPWA
jgi:hypothetical protein